jgi:SAM-dependent methyltransferase
LNLGTDREEIARIRDAYARRRRSYDPLEPWVLLTRQERERAIARWAREELSGRVSATRLVELGCGTGGNLADLLRLGFSPANLCGVDLQEERINVARRLLPPDVQLIAGEAADVSLPRESFDVVYQSLMCSSILDDGFLERVSARMWDLARPGGGVLWYDFVYNNPGNPDVRGLPLSRVKRLFPVPPASIRRLTLAPPISRRITRIWPSLYGLLNRLVFLRTHLLCWFRKPA